MVQSGKKLKSARASGRRRMVQYKKTGKKVKQVKKGAPVKGAKKSLGKYSKFYSKKLTGKINQNIEAVLAAKVIKNRGGFRLKDIMGAGNIKEKQLEKIKQARLAKKRYKPPTPDKVHVPRI